jgi:hypothetical protein
MTKSFCVFIISHGRAGNVITKRTLAKCGYTGPVFIVIDNEDKQADEYRKNFGADTVVVFDKLYYASLVDSCDNFQNRRTTTHARNACFDIAKEKGFDYFLVLDDDYTDFRFSFDQSRNFVRKPLRENGMDKVTESFCRFLDLDDRLLSACFMQTGDLIGGENSPSLLPDYFFTKRRKAMNSFFCKTDRRFWFHSRLNEDVNTYLALGSRGGIFMTLPDVYLQQKPTQGNQGGMSDAYIASGTYVKSFYTVMQFPSFAQCDFRSQMGRIHHKISWNNAVPKILDESNKK